MDDVVGAWMRGASRYRLLTGAEEVQLGHRVQRWHADPNPSDETIAAGRAARERLVRANLRLVVSVAKKYQGKGVDLADLLQSGALGLVRAAELFDPGKGFKFSTYAYNWIRQGITRLIAETTSTCATRIPNGAQDLLRHYRREVAKFSQVHGRNPSPDRLAEMRTAAGITPAQWDALAPWQHPSRSLDSLLNPDGDDDGATRLDMLISDGPSPDDALGDSDRRDQVEGLLRCLGDRERLVLRMTYGIGHPPAELRDIGRELGISPERVRQILAKGLRRLRKQASPQQAVEAAA